MRKSILTALVALAVGLLSASAARAATYTVMNLNDSGAGSLRDAIVNAIASAGADTIDFHASLAGQTISLSSTLPNITDALTIDDAGQNITISGGGLVKLLIVDVSGTLHLIGLTLEAGDPFGNGGAIRNSGTLTTTNSTFANNTAWVAVSVAGAIHNSGALTIVNSTFANNYAQGAAGAIVNSGTLTIANSTFAGNSTTGVAGAIANGGALSITNSTFAGNYGGDDVGAIANGGTMTITNSTFARNHGAHTASILNASPGTTTLRNTLIADNLGHDGSCFGAIIDGGGNLSDDATCPVPTVVLADLHLGALAHNGGPTKTIALGDGSLAIDAGVDELALDANDNPLTTDQRGVGFPRMIGRVDVGAFEALTPTGFDELIASYCGTDRGCASGLQDKAHAIVSAPNARSQAQLLEAFRRQVRAMVRNGVLTADRGDVLNGLAANL